MKILVTGNNGYVGTVLTPMLLEAGHEVVGMDINLFDGSRFLPSIPDVETLIQDIRDVEAPDLEGFDVIIHLAGLSNDPLGNYNPKLTNLINHRATVELARLAKSVGVERFLFASSCSNYGAAGNEFLTEQNTFKPVTPYARSKVNAESGLSELADRAFCPVYLRAPTAYGVSPLLRFDLVVNNLTAWAYTTKKVHIKSDGMPWRPVIHVEDIARAYIAALHAPREVVQDQGFNIGLTTENYQVLELAEIVQDVVPDCEIEFAPDAAPDPKCYRVDCNKIAKVLPEFKPQWTARRGIEELYEAYSRAGLRWGEFEGNKYSRIAHLKELVRRGDLTASLRPCGALSEEVRAADVF